MKNIFIAISSSVATLLITFTILFSMQKGEAEIIVGDANGINAGVIELYSGSAAPTGYLLCDGRAVSRTTYSELYKVIGTTYGAGDGSTTFNLPNLNGKVPVGKDSSNFTALGSTGGSINTTLSVANMPGHTHSLTPKGTISSTFTGSSATTSSSDNHTHTYKDGYSVNFAKGEGYTTWVENAYGEKKNSTTNASGSHSHTLTAKGSVTSTFTGTSTDTSSVGNGLSFTNLQPYIVVNYIIKY